MLNYKNKIPVKLIALILIQTFLLTGVVCPESLSNKKTSSLYIHGKDLRVPIGSYDRMRKVLDNPSLGKIKEKGSPLNLLEYLITHKHFKKSPTSKANPISIRDLRTARINPKTGWSYAGSTIGFEIESLIRIGILERTGKGQYVLSEEFTLEDMISIHEKTKKIIKRQGVHNEELGLDIHTLTDDLEHPLSKEEIAEITKEVDRVKINIRRTSGNIGVPNIVSIRYKERTEKTIKKCIAALILGGFIVVALYVGYHWFDPSREALDAFKSISATKIERTYQDDRQQQSYEVEEIKKMQVNNKNLLDAKETSYVEAFLKGNRIDAIRFAARSFNLEPELIAGFLYEEVIHQDTQNRLAVSAKEDASHFFSIGGAYRGTLGIGQVGMDYMMKREFLDRLFDNIDYFLKTVKSDKELKLLLEFRDFYEFWHNPNQNYSALMAHVQSEQGLIASLSGIEEVNIFATGFIIREIADQIAIDNKGVILIPDMNRLNGNSTDWVIAEYKEIPKDITLYGDLLERYGKPFSRGYYSPSMAYFASAQRYSGGDNNYSARGLTKVEAYKKMLQWGGFKRIPDSKKPSAAHFSLHSRNNSLTKEGITDKFQIEKTTYAIGEFDVDNINQLGEHIVIPGQSGQNITFTIRGPPERADLAGYLRNNPNLGEAIIRSASLHPGALGDKITIILADKYDYLAGDHRQNNLIILNASDLETMLQQDESAVLISELITSLLSEELAHERGADGEVETEERLALEAGFNTKTALKSQPNPGHLSEYIQFIERFGINAENEPGYLDYLKALNRYEDLDWTARNAPLVNDRTVVVAHMEMGLSKALLGNLHRRLMSEKGYSEQAAELEVGEAAKLTMAGGLGNIKRDLTESWAEKGTDLVSINVLYGKWIKGEGDINKDAMSHLIEMLGSPEMGFEVEIFDREDARKKMERNDESKDIKLVKTKVLIYRDPFSPFPNYWIYCPDIFDGAYPEGDEHCAQQILLYRKAGLRLLEELRKQGKVKDKFLFSLSEVYTALLIPDAVKDDFKDNPVFKDIFIHHYNHTVVPAGMRNISSSLHDFIGINSERYGYSIIEGDLIILAKIIGREADSITGCSMAHTDILRKEVMKDFREKIPGNITEENSEGVYLDNWQGEEIQKVIAKYYVRSGAKSDKDLFRKLDDSYDMRESFINDLIEASRKQKDRSVSWFNREDIDLNKDASLMSLTRRIVGYKRLDIVVEMLKNPEYRDRFIKLGISIVVGGRRFDRSEQDFGVTQIRTLEKLVEKYPELKKCVAIVLDDSRHAGYNIFIAPKVYTSVDSTIMLSDRNQEAGPTSPSKGLVNGAAMIATLDGVIPELLVPFNSGTHEGNGFKVEYDASGQPSVESLFKAMEDFSAVYRDKKLHRILIYNALKTGMLRANISTRQGPGLIKLWEEGLERKQPEKADKSAFINFLDTHKDIFIKFEEAKRDAQKLIEAGKEFTVVMFDGDSIKKRNEAFGKSIVDLMLLEMVGSFYEIVKLLSEGPHEINMKVFRRGGDEFGFIIQADGLNDFDIKAILEVVRISLPVKIKSKYGLFVIDTEGLAKEDRSNIIDELKKEGIVKGIEEVANRINVLYAKDKEGDIGRIKDKIVIASVTEIEAEFILTGSIGGLYVNQAVQDGIERKGKEINLNSIMAGVNYFLSKAQEVSMMPGERGRRKGDRIYLFSARELDEVDAGEWFHNIGKAGSSIFKDKARQEEIEQLFIASEIPENERDNQIPIVYNEQALRQMIQNDPRGMLMAIDALWANPKFDERSQAANLAGEIHKARSYLKNFYKFGMLNDALPEKMYDADWVIKVFGYTIKEELEKIFGKGFKVVIARAPPSQSPERFLIWIRPAEGEKLTIDNLGELITGIASKISDDTILKPFIAVTVTPIQRTVGHTFRIIDNLSKLYISYPSDKMDMAVANKFGGTFLKESENVRITKDGHSIVFYNGSNEQETRILRFIELQRGYALEALRTNIPEKREIYAKTLRRLYADIKGIPEDSKEVEDTIPDGIDFSEARQRIIDAIKQKITPDKAAARGNDSVATLNDIVGGLLVLLENLETAFDFDTLLGFFQDLEANLSLSDPEDINLFRLEMDKLSSRLKAKIAYNLERLKKEKNAHFPNLRSVFDMPQFYENEILSQLSIIPYMAALGFPVSEIKDIDFEAFDLIEDPIQEGEDYIFKFRKRNVSYTVRLKKDFSMELESDGIIPRGQVFYSAQSAMRQSL